MFPQGALDLSGMIERYRFKETAFVKSSIMGMVAGAWPASGRRGLLGA